MAASEWMDEHNLTWLHSPPKIELLHVDDAHQPYPLSWDEQTRLFRELPAHLARMALFKVNTGCRDQEVCGLQWDWEVAVPELGTSVFPVETINNTAWQSARRRAGLVQVRVHDLKHTFGRRLRAAGVSFEDRQDLLGHRSGRITTHYSAAEL